MKRASKIIYRFFHLNSPLFKCTGAVDGLCTFVTFFTSYFVTDTGLHGSNGLQGSSELDMLSYIRDC